MKERNEQFWVHQDNAKKAHLPMFNCCNMAMQIGLENDSEFKDKIKGDPFKIMTATKLKMCNPSEVKHPFVTLFKQLERLLSTKQEEDEPLMEHTKRFEQAQDNVKSIVGTEWLFKFVKNAKECINEAQDDVKNKLKESSNESFMACTFLRNCDSLKCRSLKKNFQTQCALNNDQCTKKMSTVSNVLSGHQWDQAHNNCQKKRKEQRQES